MKKYEFLGKLEDLLCNLSKQERDDAMQYYRDYFADAGPEKEEEIIRELGSPEQVAQVIRVSINEENVASGSYGDAGYSDYRFTKREEIQLKGSPYEEHQDGNQQKEKGQNKIGNILLIILILVLGWPIIIGVGGTVFGILVAVIVTLGTLAIVLPLAGVAIFGIGIGLCFVEIGTGLFFMGVGLLLFLVGVAFCILAIKVIGNLLPRAVRWIVKVIQNFIGRRC